MTWFPLFCLDLRWLQFSVLLLIFDVVFDLIGLGAGVGTTPKMCCRLPGVPRRSVRRVPHPMCLLASMRRKSKNFKRCVNFEPARQHDVVISAHAFNGRVFRPSR